MDRQMVMKERTIQHSDKDPWDVFFLWFFSLSFDLISCTCSSSFAVFDHLVAEVFLMCIKFPLKTHF